MLLIATLLVMLAVAYTQYHNGLFSACAMLIKVFLSGLIAFNFFEPISDALDTWLQTTFLAGCEDMISLTLLFSVSLFVLRLATNYLAPEMIAEHGVLQHLGAGAVGLITGYFVAGFLICVLQTLPLDEHFMDFDARVPGEPAYRSVYPSDRVWLSLMRHAGAMPFNWKEDRGPFDQEGTFELRYLRYRRTSETRGPMPYFGEFDRELGKYKPPT
jgi:hypothetical protein